MKTLMSRIFTGRNAVVFALPPLIMAFADLLTTLHYQPPGYWTGDRGVAIEGNPLALIALQIHPLVLLACVMVWCMGVAFLVLRLPRRWALDLALFLVLGHAFCIGQWIVNYDERSVLWLAVMLAGAAVLAVPLFIARRKENTA